VESADVEELAERLNESFNQQTQQGQTAAVQRTPAPPSPVPVPTPGATPGGGTSAGEETPINIIPDARTNRIFLMGRPVDLVFVESLIQEFDQPSSSRNFLRRKLRYLPVGEFLPVAADALERTISGTSQGGPGGASRSTGRNTATTGRTTGGVGGTTGGTGAEIGQARANLQQSEILTAPESLLVGKTLLVADNISNSIVVQGPPHHVELIETLISELDQASEQVAITAVFGRYDIGNDRNFGIDLGQTLKSVTGDLSLAGQLRNGVPSVIDPNALVDFTTLLGAAAPSSGLSLYGTIGDDFALFVNALESNSRFNAISRPTVFTTNNNAARISSGSRIAVPTSTFQGVGSGGFSTNVDFRDIVLELEVRPLVNSEEEVTLEIALVRDNTGEERVIEGFGTVPDIDTDEISTIVTVPDRSTIILGGLITEQDTDSKSGVPILSSIPGIGRLFSRTTKNVVREELVILVHPAIITNEDRLHGFQREYDTGSEIAPRARASVTTGVLPEKGITPYQDKGGGYGLSPTPAAYSAPAPETRPEQAVVVDPEDYYPPASSQPTRAGMVTSPMHQGIRNKQMRLGKP
jgi:type II secretory pathway component GspD/PulD (secretin)